MAFEALQERAGPLPVWAWGLMGAVGIGGFLLLSRAAGGSDQTRGGTLQGQPIGPIGTGNTSDPTGNLAAINGQLTELLGRVNGTGQGSGGTVTISGMQAAMELKAQSSAVQAQNANTITLIGEELRHVGANINTGQGFDEYLVRRNIFYNRVQKQVADIQHQVSAATPGLSAADAAYLQLQGDQESNAILQQFALWDRDWQRSQGVAI